MLLFAEFACSRRNVGGAGGGGIMLAPFALTATGSGASYWSGIVLAMAAQCLDAQRWIGTCAAPSLRFCHKHHGCRDVSAVLYNLPRRVVNNAQEEIRPERGGVSCVGARRVGGLGLAFLRNS